MARGQATGTAGAAAEPAGSADATAGITARSRKVRRIVRLEARARRLLTRYELALGTGTRAKAQAHALLDEAHGIECALTGTQLGELYRARGKAARSEAAARSTPSDHRSATTPS